MHADLRTRALRLSYFTVGYNMFEGIASVTAGALAGSIALSGFGLDSFIESLSGAIMIWRLRQPESGAVDEKLLEERATKLIGWSFFILAGYVVFESSRKLLWVERPDTSLFGMGIAALSLIVMPILFRSKLSAARQMGSSSLEADSKETLACTLLSVSLLLGLGLNAAFGWWWADPSAGLAIAFFLIREGMEIFGESDEESDA
jgi:divalent metal cation (Fe/Co/Zn/Cd) transporter